MAFKFPPLPNLEGGGSLSLAPLLFVLYADHPPLSPKHRITQTLPFFFKDMDSDLVQDDLEYGLSPSSLHGS
jgi:hypothetical protein